MFRIVLIPLHGIYLWTKFLWKKKTGNNDRDLRPHVVVARRQHLMV